MAGGTVEEKELLLSGLVVKEGGYIKVYNRIYELIFDISWVESQVEDRSRAQEIDSPTHETFAS